MGTYKPTGVLETELSVLHLNLKTAERDCLPYCCSLSIGNFKACPHSDILPPTRPHLPIVSLTFYEPIQTHDSMGAIPNQTTTKL